MSSFCGDHLLKTLSNLHVDLRNLSPNVLKAWFDTDCKDTRNMLNWMCSSLSDRNYVSLLETAEYFELESTLDEEAILKELGKLGPEFCTVFENEDSLDELGLLEDEINILDEENQTLDEIIAVYKKLENNIALELTDTTSKDIKVGVDSAKTQEACSRLSEKLDETNYRLRETLLKYEPDTHFVNFVEIKDYQEIIDNLKSGLTPLMELDRICLEQSDDNLTDALDRARKRILHSYQILLVNRVEIDRLNGILDFLIKTNFSDILANDVLSNNLNSEAKELYKNRLCQVLDNIALNYADYHVSQTKIRYLNRELESFKSKSESMSKLLETVMRFISYYYLTNAIQYEEMKDIRNISSFYQHMSDCISGDLEKCRHRINQMELVIDDYNTYLSKPSYEKMKLISAIANVLSRDCFDLKSALETVAKFRNEVNVLERQILINDFYEERTEILRRMKDLQIMQSFLKSGPTDKVILIPTELQQVWLEIEAHLRKESASVAQAVQIPSIARKNLTKPQVYMKQLWMNFLTNPPKIEGILKQAEAEFNERTAKHFAGYADANGHKSFV